MRPGFTWDPLTAGSQNTNDSRYLNIYRTDWAEIIRTIRKDLETGGKQYAHQLLELPLPADFKETIGSQRAQAFLEFFFDLALADETLSPEQLLLRMLLLERGSWDVLVNAIHVFPK